MATRNLWIWVSLDHRNKFTFRSDLKVAPFRCNTKMERAIFRQLVSNEIRRWHGYMGLEFTTPYPDQILLREKSRVKLMVYSHAKPYKNPPYLE